MHDIAIMQFGDCFERLSKDAAPGLQGYIFEADESAEVGVEVLVHKDVLVGDRVAGETESRLGVLLHCGKMRSLKFAKRARGTSFRMYFWPSALLTILYH